MPPPPAPPLPEPDGVPSGRRLSAGTINNKRDVVWYRANANQGPEYTSSVVYYTARRWEGDVQVQLDPVYTDMYNNPDGSAVTWTTHQYNWGQRRSAYVKPWTWIEFTAPTSATGSITEIRRGDFFHSVWHNYGSNHGNGDGGNGDCRGGGGVYGTVGAVAGCAVACAGLGPDSLFSSGVLNLG